MKPLETFAVPYPRRPLRLPSRYAPPFLRGNRPTSYRLITSDIKVGHIETGENQGVLFFNSTLKPLF